jgi:hypothetical protein
MLNSLNGVKMKSIILLALALSAQAFATDVVLKCSNSDGSVKWESGVADEGIQLEYRNFIQGVLTLNMDQVKIEFLNETLISDKNLKECGYNFRSRVFASEVRISGSTTDPDVLKSYFPMNRVETAVICTMNVRQELRCPR